MKRASSSVVKPVLTLASLGVVLVLVGSVLGWDLGFTRPKKGDVRGTGTARNPLDSDGDGVVNPDDPLPFSNDDPDNDGVANRVDRDDDGDGVPDEKDFARDKGGKKIDLSFDQNNNRKTDAEERHVNANFDGNQNRIPDRRDWLNVATAGAEEAGLEVPASITSLAQLRDLGYKFDNLSPGWYLITHDRNGDGYVDGLGVNAPPGSETGPAAYFRGGAFDQAYRRFGKKDHPLGDTIRCLACEGTERGERRNYEVPAWASAQRGNGFLGRLFRRGGGADSPYKKFHDFYGGKHTGQYVSTPQFTGGKVSGYVSVAGRGGGSGNTGKQSGGSWLSGGLDTGGVVGTNPPAPTAGGGGAGGGGHVSGGGGGGAGGGGGGGHVSGGAGAGGGVGAPPPPPSGGGYGGGG